MDPDGRRGVGRDHQSAVQQPSRVQFGPEGPACRGLSRLLGIETATVLDVASIRPTRDEGAGGNVGLIHLKHREDR